MAPRTHVPWMIERKEHARRRISVPVSLLVLVLVGLGASRAVSTDAPGASPEATPVAVSPVLLA